MNLVDRVRQVVGPSPVIGAHPNGSLLVLGHTDPETAMYDLHRAGYLVLLERANGAMVVREKPRPPARTKTRRGKNRVKPRKNYRPGADGRGAAK